MENSDNRKKLENISQFDEWNKTLDVLMSHESIRSFSSKKVPEEFIEAILTASRSAPTSSNLQAYSIILVKDREKKERIAQYSGSQKFIIDSPVYIVFCADVYRLKYVTNRQGYEFRANTLEMLLLSSIDSAFVMQNSLIAAESLGLAAVPIGSIRNKTKEVSKILELPKGVVALTSLVIGYEKPNTRKGVKPRLPSMITVHNDKYSTENLEEGLEKYDDELIMRGVYKNREVQIDNVKEKQKYGWCEHTARRCTNPDTISAAASLRENLKNDLKELGFIF